MDHTEEDLILPGRYWNWILNGVIKGSSGARREKGTPGRENNTFISSEVGTG